MGRELKAERVTVHSIVRYAQGRCEEDYYVGRVESYANLHSTERHDEGKTISLMTADLRLAKPLGVELYRHLTGHSDV